MIQEVCAPDSLCVTRGGGKVEQLKRDGKAELEG